MLCVRFFDDSRDSFDILAYLVDPKCGAVFVIPKTLNVERSRRDLILDDRIRFIKRLAKPELEEDVWLRELISQTTISASMSSRRTSAMMTSLALLVFA
jgi:hypothetical protein